MYVYGGWRAHNGRQISKRREECGMVCVVHHTHTRSFVWLDLTHNSSSSSSMFVEGKNVDSTARAQYTKSRAYTFLYIRARMNEPRMHGESCVASSYNKNTQTYINPQKTSKTFTKRAVYVWIVYVCMCLYVSVYNIERERPERRGASTKFWEYNNKILS